MPTEAKFLGVYGAVWLAVLLAAATALFTRRMVHLTRVLSLGRNDNRFDLLGMRLATFVREVLFQTRMLKGEPIIKWAHPLIFWGFCLFVIASALLFVGGIAAPWLRIPQAEEIPVLGSLIDVFAVAVLIGLIASSVRRYVFTPPGLQRTADATIVVSLIAALMVTYLLAEAGSCAKGLSAGEAGRPNEASAAWLPAGSALAHGLLATGVSAEAVIGVGAWAWWFHALILLFFLVYLPYSKHMHLLWAPFSVFFAELPEKGTLPAAAESSAAGPARPLSPFTWRMLLNAYACAECGRCERVCPAAASGASLSPRQVVHELKHFVSVQGAAALRTGHANGGAEEFIGGAIPADALWGCATCYACVEKCPVRNEHVALIVEMRRKLVEQGKVDATLQGTLLSLQRYGNSQTKAPRKRPEWAKGLPVPIKDARKQPVDLLWFVGDYAALHPSAMRVSQMVAQVFQAVGLDFGILGDSEQSAGNDVRRMGEEGLFDLLAEKNMAAMGKAQFARIVTTDPHTYHTLKHEYRRRGLDKPVLHYSEVFDDLLRQGKLPLKRRLTACAVYHDPCYLGRYNGVYDAPRRVIDALGIKRLELPRSRDDSFCCGAGGGKIWMQEEKGVVRRPAVLRIDEALTMPEVRNFVVACPKDLTMFQDAVKAVGAEDRLAVVDLGELVFEAMGLSTEVLEPAK